MISEAYSILRWHQIAIFFFGFHEKKEAAYFLEGAIVHWSNFECQVVQSTLAFQLELVTRPVMRIGSEKMQGLRLVRGSLADEELEEGEEEEGAGEDSRGRQQRKTAEEDSRGRQQRKTAEEEQEEEEQEKEEEEESVPEEKHSGI
jgi:signal transduction histidine kinase